MNLLEMITKQINADSAALMVPNEEKRYNYCYDSYNMPLEWTAIKNSFDEKVPGGNVEVYKTGKPAITNHLNKLLEGHHLESVMIVPVLRKGQTIATLELVRSDNKDDFTERDLATAQQVAEQFAYQLLKQ